MKAQIGRHGLEHDYRGAHCTLEHDGRMLLGTIVDVCHDEYLCTVRHFNGEMWPINPSLGRLEILERTASEQNRYARAISGIDAKACNNLNTGLRKVWGLNSTRSTDKR